EVLAGLDVRQHDAVEELAQAGLALGTADGATEVLGGDDRRGVEAPEIGELHATLLEHGLAGLPVGLDDVATFPRDRVIRMDALGRVDTLDLESVLGGLAGARG